jgi:hypothetical protein
LDRNDELGWAEPRLVGHEGPRGTPEGGASSDCSRQDSQYSTHLSCHLEVHRDQHEQENWQNVQRTKAYIDTCRSFLKGSCHGDPGATEYLI